MKTMVCHNPTCELEGQDQEVEFLPGDRVLSTGGGQMRKGTVLGVRCRQCDEPLSAPVPAADDLPA